MERNESRELLEFIDRSPECYHVIENLKEMLQGAVALEETEEWKLEPGKTYYVDRNGSSLIAFRIPESGRAEGFQIGAAHSDFPAFKVKPNSEIAVEEHYTKLNVEKYGGMLYAPWLDRPLSVAGRLIVRDGARLRTKLVNIDRDLLLIPNLAIHMNRQANEGMTCNPQIDLLPLMGGIEANGRLLSLAAEAAGVAEEDIMGTDLFLYNRMKGTIWGADHEFISSRSLDDLQCAWALMKGFVQAEPAPDRAAVCCIFDNEEAGSLTKQGADSTFLQDVLSRISQGMGHSPQKHLQSMGNSFMVSADNAHAVHPNHPESADPTNRPYLNGGIVIKYNANQKYTTDGISEAIFRLICERAGVPCQTYCNRSDIAGGSTLGNISNAHVSINTVDIGLPQLAMHSPYETAGAKDTGFLVKAMKAFFESAVKKTSDGYEL